MTTTTTTRTTTTTTRTRTRTRTRRRTRSNNNNDDNNDNDDDDNDDDDNEDAARSMSCPQVQMKSPSLFPSPDPYRHRRCAKLYSIRESSIKVCSGRLLIARFRCPRMLQHMCKSKLFWNVLNPWTYAAGFLHFRHSHAESYLLNLSVHSRVSSAMRESLAWLERCINVEIIAHRRKKKRS